jgi:chromate reductase, NAD(P)H dehydrogenase (quinone)
MSNTGPLRILAVSGSLRRRSFNTALLEAAIELAPPGVELVRFAHMREMPHFDEDLEVDTDPSVEAWRSALRGANALLVATPEYNASMPSALKNAIDWASRPLSETTLRGLPVAVMGASPGGLGSVRAQLHLRDALAAVGAHVLPAPDVVVARAPERFDADLRLVDEPTRAAVARAIARLADLARRLSTNENAA